MAQPTAEDLHARLLLAGLLSNPVADVQQLLSLQDIINAAWSDWESAVGYSPFLAETSDSTRYYTAPDGELFSLPVPYYSITSLTYGVTSSYVGTVATLNTDYWLDPTDDVPIWMVRWGGILEGGPRSVKVIGKRGYALDTPADVKYAVLTRAVNLARPDLEAQITGGLSSIKLGNSDFKFGALEKESSGLTLFSKPLIRKYRRTVVA